MLTLKVRLPNGTMIEGTTTNSQLRLRYGKAAKKSSVPTVVERTAILVIPVPVRETIFVAPPLTPTAEDIAHAILQELDGLERLHHDLQQPEEGNGQPRSWANLKTAFSPVSA